ncbi:ankyrin repeat and SOCS box protein 2-like [Lingula anatina]|uniref:Ankyrin repeat and SOCS box protein 2-like n=1 Tax=Lingula anatina TaxID=7574 RepID=A0A1S3HKT5_LINAN|nr:ankyrin repeat and SOCS box protein 2-like [Lingula anatina]|eukprot:XP_013385619.1 ankyrin repeat and SOCS box protein 2-like [Lingula anatina]
MTLEERSRLLLDELFNERNNANIDLLLRREIDELLGIPPLLVVSSFGHLVGLKALIAAGADVNTRSKTDGSSALIHAVKCGNPTVMQELLQHGADPSFEDNEGMNPLMVAVMKKDSGPVNVLWQYKHKLDINRSNKNGYTLLMIAADKNWESCVNMLISAGADKHKQANCKNLTSVLIGRKKFCNEYHLQ